jgi:hypothetical protein
MASPLLPEDPSHRRALALVGILVLVMAFATAINASVRPSEAAVANSVAACSNQLQIDKTTAALASASSTLASANLRVASATAAVTAAGATKAKLQKLELLSAREALARAKVQNTTALAAHNRIVAKRCPGTVTGTTPATTTSAASISVEYVSASADRTFHADDPGEVDTVQYRIRFKVTAIGEDVYLDGDTNSKPDGLNWSSTSDTVGAVGMGSVLTASNGSQSGDVTNSFDRRFKIAQGNTREFTLTALMQAYEDNARAAIQLNWLKWDTLSRDAMVNQYTVDSEIFRTDLVLGLRVL